jgi:hypothetical protein
MPDWRGAKARVLPFVPDLRVPGSIFGADELDEGETSSLSFAVNGAGVAIRPGSAN